MHFCREHCLVQSSITWSDTSFQKWIRHEKKRSYASCQNCLLANIEWQILNGQLSNTQTIYEVTHVMPFCTTRLLQLTQQRHARLHSKMRGGSNRLKSSSNRPNWIHTHTHTHIYTTASFFFFIWEGPWTPLVLWSPRSNTDAAGEQFSATFTAIWYQPLLASTIVMSDLASLFVVYTFHTACITTSLQNVPNTP